MAAKRKQIASKTKESLLLKSKRRCALCFLENRDARSKEGAIAHINRNPSSVEEDNLIFVCLDHHAEMDAGQGWREDELKVARDELYKHLAAEESRPPVSALEARGYEEHVVDAVRSYFSERLGDFFTLNRNVLYKGRSGVSYEVDLATDFGLGGVRYLTVFEIKHRRAPIGVEDILSFAATARDIRADKAIFICTGGFSASAIRVAFDQGMGLMITDAETGNLKPVGQ